MSSIVESDETYILESEKGKKGGTAHRKSRNRGSSVKKRGISSEQVSIVVANDRNGVISSQMGGRRRITSAQITQVIGNLIHKDAVLCTDSATNYKSSIF